MKHCHYTAAVLFALLTASAATQQASAATAPVLVFQTSYDQTAKKHDYTIQMGATEATTVTIEAGGTSQEVALSPTPVTVKLTATPDGLVKVYGEASKINMLSMPSVRLADLDCEQLTELTYIDISGNLLRSANLTPQTKLEYANLGSNPYSRSGRLTVGPAKPALKTLMVNDIDYLDAAFSLTEYPALLTFNGANAMSLNVVDPSGCPNLQTLDVSGTGIATLNVSANAALTSLKANNTKLTTLGLAGLPALKTLEVAKSADYIGGKIETIDLSGLTALQNLNVAYNALETLDATACAALQSLDASYNVLESVDVTGLTALTALALDGNVMTFATLPLPSDSYTSYTYAQQPLQVRTKYAENAPIDLAYALDRDNSVTTVKVTDAQGAEIEDSKYTFENNVLTFNTVLPTAVKAAFSNTLFPEAALYTTAFEVLTAEEAEQMNLAISLQPKEQGGAVAIRLGVKGATEKAPAAVYADFGDGQKVPFTVTGSAMPTLANVTGTVSGGTVNIYTEDPTIQVSAFGLAQLPLTSADITNCPALYDLSMTGCGIQVLDMTYNAQLESVDLSDNEMYYLDMSSADSKLIKSKLKNIKADHNVLRSVLIINPYTLVNVDLGNNQLSEFPLEMASNMKSLKLNVNNLDSIHVRDCISLEYLDVAQNNITEFIYPARIPLKYLNLSGNKFVLPRLPLPGTFPSYTYAPQQKYQLPASACSVFLRDELLDINGQNTSFVWKSFATDQPVAAGKVSEFEGGFGFVDPSVGDLYCVISHPAFPDFTGENQLETTVVTPKAAPSIDLGGFTPAVEGMASATFQTQNNAPFYIDWQNMGIWEEYAASTENTYTGGHVLANAPVRFRTTSATASMRLISVGFNEQDTERAFESIDFSDMNSLVGLYIYGQCNPAKLNLPSDLSGLTELKLMNVGISEFDLTQCPKLTVLGLSQNNLTSVDLSLCPRLLVAYLEANPLENFVYDNPAMWELNVTNCGLESLDLSKLPKMKQLLASGNNLTELDITPAPLIQLRIARNKFNFATLPPHDAWYDYVYWPQQEIEVKLEDGRVDLSNTLESYEGAETLYLWFEGLPTVDETGAVVGDQLRLNTDYKVENGVTTFLKKYDGVYGAMLNATYPALMLITNKLDVTPPAGIDTVICDGDADAEFYTLTGLRLEAPTPGVPCIQRGKGVVIL